MKKRVLMFVMAAALLAGAITGCSKLKGTETLVQINDIKVTADVANFYSRYQQAQYETYYASYMGEDMWGSEVEEGKTYEKSVKDGLLTNLQNMYLIDAHKKEYNIELTEEEKNAIQKAAKDFVKANGETERNVVSGEVKTIEEVLSLMTIESKMFKAMTSDVSEEVSDEEAAQKKMEYVQLSFSPTDDQGNATKLTEDQLAELKTKAEEFNTKIAEGADFKQVAAEYEFSPQEVTFDAKAVSPSEELVKAADALAEGETTGVIETDNAYFVAKVTTLLDRDATEAKKQSIVTERKNEAHKKLIDKWTKDADIKVDKGVWKKISFASQGVKIKQEEQKDTAAEDSPAPESDGAPEDTAGDTGTGDTADSENTDGTQADPEPTE